MQYESTFEAIDRILRNEAGCSTELDYIQQTSWLLFLKYLDDLEKEREMEAVMSGKQYKPILSGFYRWEKWAAPKNAASAQRPFPEIAKGYVYLVSFMEKLNVLTQC